MGNYDTAQCEDPDPHEPHWWQVPSDNPDEPWWQGCNGVSLAGIPNPSEPVPQQMGEVSE